MNKNVLRWVVGGLWAVAWGAGAQTLVDDFEDGVLDLDKWTPTESYDISAVAEEDGVLKLVYTGIVSAVPDFGPCIVTSGFRFTGSYWDHFDIVLRSDGEMGGPYGRPRNGIVVAIRPTANPDALEVALIHIEAISLLAANETPFPILLNEDHVVTVEDDGANITVSIDDQLVLSHDTNVDDGDRVHLANGNKPGYACRTEVDWVEIVSTRRELDIRANGSDELVVLDRGERLLLTADLAADPSVSGDTWILAQTPRRFPLNIFSYDLGRSAWVPWLFTGYRPSAQGAIPQLNDQVLLDSAGLPAGAYTFYLGYDAAKNRRIDFDSLELDTVPVLIERPTMGVDLSSGLLAHYRLDGDGQDATTNLNHGTVYGAVPASNRFGVPARAMDFDGANDQIDVGAPLLDTEDAGHELTLAAWILASNVDEDRWVLCQYRGVTGDLSRFTWGLRDGRIRYFRGGGAVFSDTVLEPNTWYHIATTKDASGAITHYVNGETAGSGTLQGAFSQTNTLIGGGSFNGGINYTWSGAIDDLRVYDRTLNAKEIRRLWLRR